MLTDLSQQDGIEFLVLEEIEHFGGARTYVDLEQVRGLEALRFLSIARRGDCMSCDHQMGPWIKGLSAISGLKKLRRLHIRGAYFSEADEAQISGQLLARRVAFSRLRGYGLGDDRGLIARHCRGVQNANPA